MENNAHYYVAIMAGGVGSRFWPLSRDAYPKQFLPIADGEESLLQATYRRFEQLVPAERILVVTAESYRDLVMQQLPQLRRENILCEPMRKNTAPCVAYVSFVLRERDPEASLICAPSDHYVKNEQDFIATCRRTLEFVSLHKRYFVTLGIKPTSPHTGYGYIQYLPEDAQEDLKRVKTFTEKPSFELAQTFVEDGYFLWNAGLFIAYNAFMLEMIRVHIREVYDLFNSHARLLNTLMEKQALEKIYPLCPANSFDYAVMEKTKNEVYVIAADFGWSDLGSWNSLPVVRSADEQGNLVNVQNSLIQSSHNNIIHISQGNKMLVLDGLENYIVVDTKDVLLICPRHKDQEIKNYTEKLKANKLTEYL